jgi:hypothetical protein
MEIAGNKFRRFRPKHRRPPPLQRPRRGGPTLPRRRHVDGRRCRQSDAASRDRQGFVQPGDLRQRNQTGNSRRLRVIYTSARLCLEPAVACTINT